LAKTRAVSGRAYSVIRIGALFSLTGDGASLGAASAAALELAVRDVNRELDVCICRGMSRVTSRTRSSAASDATWGAHGGTRHGVLPSNP